MRLEAMNQQHRAAWSPARPRTLRSTLVLWLLIVGCSARPDRNVPDAAPRIEDRSTPIALNRPDQSSHSGSSRFHEGQDVEPPREFVGVVVVRDAVDISVEVEGRLASMTVDVGDPVEAGAILATVASREIHEQLAMAHARLAASGAEKREAEVAVLQAQRRLDRRRSAPEIFSRETTDEIADQLAVAKAAVERLDALVARDQAEAERVAAHLDRASIRAPIRGRIASRTVEPGTLVRVGDVIARLIAPESVFIRFAVPPNLVTTMATGQEIRFTTDAKEAATGIVSRIAPEVDAASALVFVEADLVDGQNAAATLRAGSVGAVQRE